VKARLLILFSYAIVFITGNCFAQAKFLAEISPDSINTRITRYRMGDIIVKTKPGAEVKIQQVRHEFLFGTAITNHLAEKDTFAMSPSDRKMFIKILAENFNYAVHENALKWYDCEKVEGKVDYYTADRIWEICDSLHIPMRGHCIFWAKDKYIQPWLFNLNNDELRAAINRRAIGVTSHFKGRINEYDLNNEMINGDFFRRRLGYGIVNEMAYMALAGDPDIRLCVNDYGVLDMGFNADSYYYQIKNLLANRVPIGGINCQGHLSLATTDTVTAWRVQRTLDRLAEFGLPIKITECLFNYADEQVQVEEINKLFPIYFAFPNIEAIVMWGFWAKGHWQPQSAMYRTDWSPRPQALAYRDLVFKKWWTSINAKADKNGMLKERAFYGDYEITSNGVTKKVILKKKDKTVEVNFD
jgi:endo-1,4-beta-xylanase